jgi:hypothetical protein
MSRQWDCPEHGLYTPSCEDCVYADRARAEKNWGRDITITIEDGGDRFREALAREIAALLDSLNVRHSGLKDSILKCSSDYHHKQIDTMVDKDQHVVIFLPKCSVCGGDGFDMTLDGPTPCERCQG